MPERVLTPIESVPIEIKEAVDGVADAEIDFVMGRADTYGKLRCTHSRGYDKGDLYEIDRRLALRYVQKMRPDLQPHDEKGKPQVWPSRWGDSMYLHRSDAGLKLLTKAEARAVVRARAEVE